MAKQREGRIKRIVVDRDTGQRKGFGFIQSDGGEEFFFHASGIVSPRFDECREGDRVAFDPQEGPKGPRAENITVVEDTRL